MPQAEAVIEPPVARRQSIWRGLSRNPALVVWCSFVLLIPVYVVTSGLPQPSDALIVLLVPMVLYGWNGKLERENVRILRALMWFTLWVVIVNYGWAAVLGRWGRLKDFLIHPLYYLFNAAVLFGALLLARRDRDRFLRITVEIVFATIVIQVAASFYFRTNLYRETIFFNSPNQLGYYALLAACLFAMTQRPLGISRLRSSIAVTCCAYLALLSASRGALAGIAVLLFVLVFSNPKTVVIASLAAIGLITVGGPVSKAIDAAEERATTVRNPNMTFAEERGYDRIWRNPEYLLLGAGEGAYERFTEPGEKPRELHSSFGSVLFGYGIVGVSLFLVFFVRVVRGAPLRMSAMLVPALVYTVAHQGLRFTMFWVVLAVFVVLKQTGPERTRP
jgi:hypothetical protein